MNSVSKKPRTRASNRIIKSLDDIDALMILMRKNRIDYVQLEGMTFTKSQHEVVELKASEIKENDFWVNPN